MDPTRSSSPSGSVSHAAGLSRFLQRWLAGDPGRAARLEGLVGNAPDRTQFQRLLTAERDAGASLAGAMRRVRNLIIATLICRDLGGQADLAEVVEVMTDFADFAVKTHTHALHEEQCALYGRPIGEDSGREQHLLVIGMGKLGGGELNVSSDIDLIFLYPEDGETDAAPGQKSLSNHEFFIRLGKKLIGALSEITEDGFTFRVDMALRPNGGSGPLAASFNMLEEYLIVQGREWERYAWVKARALTGEEEDIAALDRIVRPFVYRRYLDFGAIDALRAMHGQIRAEVLRQEARHPERSLNVKLGRGGIREIEFLTQVFQLIRGGREPELRDHSTRATLRVIADMQLLEPDVVGRLADTYTFLRNLEHRIQYLDDAQTHNLPPGEEDRTLVAGMMGYADAAQLMSQLDMHRRFVAERFDVIFGAPETAPDANGESVAKTDIADGDAADSMLPQLAQLGFDDAAGAASRLAATWESPRLRMLPETSRSRLVLLINQALPVISSLPDAHAATLNRLLDFLEAIGRRAAYLALMVEYPPTLTRVIRMMHASSWAATYLTRHPLLLDELIDDGALNTPPDWPAFAAECRRLLETAAGDPERQMDILREMHHAQQFRLLSQDLDGRLSVERLADHLSMLADILVGVTLEAVWQAIPNRHRDTPKFAAIAYGKLGGKELGYASDLDLVFLYDDEDQDAPPLYAKLAQRFITWMTSHTPAGTLFDIDLALRPDGASGLMITTVAAFERYQRQSAWIWEHQALTRARFCAGDEVIGARFETIREAVLRQPRDVETLRREVLSMRERMHRQHPNPSGLFDLKHDAGGMIDIEFMVQYLILRHAPDHPELAADIGNIALLGVLGSLRLIDADLARRTADAYRLFRRLQHAIRLQGADRARVAPERVGQEAAAVTSLWNQVFG